MKVCLFLNVLAFSCSISLHLQLLTYQFTVFNFPQLEATITEKKIVNVVTVFASIILAFILIPRFYNEWGLKTFHIYLLLSTTVFVGLCGVLFFQREESIYFPSLISFLLAFLPVSATVLLAKQISSQLMFAILLLMTRTSYMSLSAFAPIFLVKGLRNALYEDAVEFRTTLMHRWFNSDDRNVRFNAANEELIFDGINSHNHNHNNNRIIQDLENVRIQNHNDNNNNHNKNNNNIQDNED